MDGPVPEVCSLTVEPQLEWRVTEALPTSTSTGLSWVLLSKNDMNEGLVILSGFQIGASASSLRSFRLPLSSRAMIRWVPGSMECVQEDGGLPAQAFSVASNQMQTMLVN